MVLRMRGSRENSDESDTDYEPPHTQEASDSSEEEVVHEPGVPDGEESDSSDGAESDNRAPHRNSDDLTATVADIYSIDCCEKTCLQGMVVGSLQKITCEEKQSSLTTALAVLTVAGTTKRRRSKGDRKRFAYYLPFLGQVCASAFCAVRQISTPTLTVYRNRVQSGEIDLAAHSGKNNQNSSKLDLVWLANWFTELAPIGAQQIPLRVRRQKTVNGVVTRYLSKEKYMLLSSLYTWKTLFQEMEADEDKPPDGQRTTLNTFRKMLQRYCPRIAIKSPHPNVCDKCVIYKNLMATTPTTTTNEDMEAHTTSAAKMRILTSLVTFVRREEYVKETNAVDDQHIVLTTDYSQNLTLPSAGDTPSSWYFSSLVSASLFGIHDAASKNQINYAYTERKGGKGSNEVMSMLVMHLEPRQDPGKTLTMYADNCGGQNKNNFVVKLFVLLAHLGFFKEINFKLSVKGHTENACGRGFEHI